MTPLKAALVVSDGLSAVFVFLVLTNVRFDVLGGTWSLGDVRPIELAIGYAVLWVSSLWLLGLYRLRTHWALRGELVDVLRATVLLFFVSLSVLYVFNLTAVSRVFIGMLFLVQPAVAIVSRFARPTACWE